MSQIVHKNILIIKPSSLGDIVLALPALSALRDTFPEAKITWLVRPEFAPILNNHPALTDIILFDRKLLGKAWFKPAAFSALISLIRHLRNQKFDAVIDLQGLFRTACLSWLTGCKKRFGMANAREFAPLFYTHKVPQNPECTHLVDYYLKIAKTAGAVEAEAKFVFPQNSAANDSVNKLLTSHGINRDNYAVFIPGSAHKDKCWPQENFAALADKISSRFDLPIITAGTSSETVIAEKIKKLANTPITNFAGLTNLNELVDLLRSAKIVISNDTGPGHIAAALGSPLVLMYGWSNPARITPYNRKHCALGIDLYTRGRNIKSTNPKHSVKNITIDEVFQKTCEQLK